MFQEDTVELTPQHRESLLVLKREDGTYKRGIALWAGGFCLLGAVIGGGLALWWPELGAIMGALPAIIGIVLFFLAGNYSRISKPTLRTRLRMKYGTERRMEITSAMEITGLSEDPTHRCVLAQIDPENMVFLHGSYLDEPLGSGFPCERSYWVLDKKKRFAFCWKGEGQPITLSESRHYGELAIEGVWLPADGDLIKGQVGEAEAALRRHIDGAED